MALAIERSANIHRTEHELSPPQIKRKASEILDTGDRDFRKDNYEKRMDRFAREMGQLDSQSRADLFNEILRQDTSAFDSWLTTKRLDTLLKRDDISRLERDAVVDGFVNAYNNKQLTFDEAAEFIKYGEITDRPELDGAQFLGDGSDSPEGNERIEWADRLLAGLSGDGSTAATEQFARDFSTEAFKELFKKEPTTFGQEPDRSKPARDSAEASLLLNMLYSTGGTDAVNSVISGLSAEQKNQLRDFAVQDGRWLPQTLKDIGAEHLKDPMEILIQNTRDHGSRQDVLDMVRYVNSKPDEFYDRDHTPLEGRAKSLADLFNRHSKDILNDLTVDNEDHIKGSSNPEATVLGENLIVLSNLLRLTAVQGRAENRASVFESLAQYTGQKIPIANSEKVDIGVADNAEHRVGMIGAALQDAVAQGYADLSKDKSANEDLLSFAIDLAISAIPVGGVTASKIGDRVSSSIYKEGSDGANLLKNNIEESLNGLADYAIYTTQGQLTDEAKKAILEEIKTMPAQYQKLESSKESVDNFIKDVVKNNIKEKGDNRANIALYRGYMNDTRGQGSNP